MGGTRPKASGEPAGGTLLAPSAHSISSEKGTVRANLLVGQSGGPTAVMNASLVGVIDEAKQHQEIDGIFGSLNGIEGLLHQRFVDLRREQETVLQALKSTPAAALGSCRYSLSPGDLALALKTIEEFDIRYFLYIGGNDSADTSHRLAMEARSAGYDLRVIGIPKTIDNDLAATDHCPGYGSIARFVAIATMDAGKDTEAMRSVDPIKIIEVMGRNAGWVAAASALGKREESDAPHLIYFPERPLVADRFIRDVQRVYDQLGYAVIVITETVRDEKGRPWASGYSLMESDNFGHRRLSGAAEALCRLIGERLGLHARWDKPGTIQRMSVACGSQVDIEEAYAVGRQAVRDALVGHSDCMVVLKRQSGRVYACSLGLAPLEEIANKERRLPDEYINAEGNFVTPAFFEYALPLIGGPLPDYARLRKVPVRHP